MAEGYAGSPVDPVVDACGAITNPKINGLSHMTRDGLRNIPGCLYHLIARGLEQGKIFIEDDDYVDVLSRLEKKLDKTGSVCYAFGLLPDHLFTCSF